MQNITHRIVQRYQRGNVVISVKSFSGRTKFEFKLTCDPSGLFISLVMVRKVVASFVATVLMVSPRFPPLSPLPFSAAESCTRTSQFLSRSLPWVCLCLVCSKISEAPCQNDLKHTKCITSFTNCYAVLCCGVLRYAVLCCAALHCAVL